MKRANILSNLSLLSLFIGQSYFMGCNNDKYAIGAPTDNRQRSHGGRININSSLNSSIFDANIADSAFGAFNANQGDMLSSLPPLLYTAVEKGDRTTVRVLIKHNADVNETYAGKSVLYLAVEQRKLDIVQKLVKHNADVNATYAGKSVLYLAVEQGKLDIVRELVKHNADVNATYAGKSVLYLAVEQENLDILRKLVKCKKLNIHASYIGKTALQQAEKKSDKRIYNLLINYKP